MNRWTIISLFAVTLAAVGCGGSGGSGSSSGSAPDASIALALQMINTDTTETSDPWSESRTGSEPASQPEEAEASDV